MKHNIPSVLFVCTGNAGRSQIAQATLKQRKADVRVESAGVEPWEDLHPMAVQVMRDRGIDHAGQFPKHAETFQSDTFDVVVTIGDPARAKLPRNIVKAACWIHWDLADPADADGTDRSRAVFEHTANYVAAHLPQIEALLDQRSAAAPRAKLKAGISTGLWMRNPLDAAMLQAVKAAGFDAIELNLFFGRDHFDDQNSNAVAELSRIANSEGVDIWSIHSPDVASLADADPARRRAQCDALKANLQLADQLGAFCVVSHGLLLPPRDIDDIHAADVLARLDQSLAELMPIAEQSSARIAFENGYTRCYSAASVLDRLARLPDAACGFCLDTGHANIAGDAGPIAERAKQQLITLHLNDNNAKLDNHLAPKDEGANVDWPFWRSWLRDVDYEGCVMYELLPGDKEPTDILRRTAAWHQTWWNE